jgi:hypothetical protein
MQLTNLPPNTSGVLYQNDSPTPLLVTVQVGVRLAPQHNPSFSTLLGTRPTKRLLRL